MTVPVNCSYAHLKNVDKERKREKRTQKEAEMSSLCAPLNTSIIVRTHVQVSKTSSGVNNIDDDFMWRAQSAIGSHTQLKNSNRFMRTALSHSQHREATHEHDTTDSNTTNARRHDRSIDAAIHAMLK